MKLIDVLSSNPIKGAFLFAVIAPPLGAFVVSTLAALPFLWLAIKNQDAVIAFSSLFVVIFVTAFSHIFGAIPAIITGFIVGMRRSMLSTWYGPLVSGVLGALITTFTYSVIIQPPDAASILDTLDSEWDSLLIFGLCAFFGGSVAGWLFRMRPNNSFKPKPLRGSA